MDATYDNSNGTQLDNLSQDILQKSNVLDDGDIVMDIKNTNITSPSFDNLNNIQSYTTDNPLKDQNRLSQGEYILDDNNQQLSVPFDVTNGKKSEFPDNYTGPESNVDDDTNYSTKNEFNETEVDNVRSSDLYQSRESQFEDMTHLKTVDEAEEGETKQDMDLIEQDCEDFERKSSDATMDSLKLNNFDCDLSNAEVITPCVAEKSDDPVEDTKLAENVIVQESGEESEDEWNYIKVKHENNEHETQNRTNTQPLVQSLNSSDLVIDNQDQDDEIARIEEEDMASKQLNPDAKEFVPNSPSPTNQTPVNYPEVSGINAAMAALNINFANDIMVAQSPQKSTTNTMANVIVPDEDDFIVDIAKRPSELEPNAQDNRPDSSNSQCSYQEMNLKEAMHGDEKQEYGSDATPELITDDQLNVDHEAFIEILNKSMRDQDPMSASFYNDGSGANNPFTVDLNAVHRLPTSDDENETDRSENKNRESATFGTAFGAKFECVDTRFDMDEFVETYVPALQAESEEKADAAENQSNNIVEAVQEMISENMAVLNQCDLLGNENILAKDDDKKVVEFDNVESSVPSTEVIEQLTNAEDQLNVDAELTVVKETEDVASTVAEVTAIANNVETVIEATIPTEPVVEQSIPIESIVDLTSPIEPVVFAAPPVEPLTDGALPIEPVVEVIETTVVTNTVSENEIVPIAEVAVVAGAVTAAAAVAAEISTKSKTVKPTESKPKSSVAAKKTATTVSTAKPKPKPDVVASKAAPIPRPRTVASQSSTKLIDRKTTTTVASSLSKKPVNGEAKTTTTTTTTTTTKRPNTTSTIKSTATTARAAPLTSTTKLTSTRTVTKTSSLTSSTTDTVKRSPSTRTTTSSTTTSVVQKSRSTTDKPNLSNPKSLPSKAATSVDKSKDTSNKQLAPGVRLHTSPRTTSAAAQRTAATAKKIEQAKSLSASATTKRSPAPLSSSDKQTITKSTIQPKTQSSPQKRPISSTLHQRSTTTTATGKKPIVSAMKKATTPSKTNEKDETKPKENGTNGMNGTNGTNGINGMNDTNELNETNGIDRNAIMDNEEQILL